MCVWTSYVHVLLVECVLLAGHVTLEGEVLLGLTLGSLQFLLLSLHHLHTVQLGGGGGGGKGVKWISHRNFTESFIVDKHTNTHITHTHSYLHTHTHHTPTPPLPSHPHTHTLLPSPPLTPSLLPYPHTPTPFLPEPRSVPPPS